MKNSIFRYIAILLAFIALAPCAQAQHFGEEKNDIVIFTTHDIANYDSLLHSYYLRKYAASVNHHYNRKTNSPYASFDMVPDSVLQHRLKALPTVIPMTYNHDVRMWIATYVRLMERRCDVMLTLSEYYFPMFEQVLNQYKVPMELKYLTIIESALNPQATSRAGAAGLWQFMYPTGKLYGLEVNSLWDDRRDPYLSTVAAARHLKDLYEIFGDWQLALAAYNCGAGNVRKAIARSGGNLSNPSGKRTFWQIYDYLPRETRGYVPAFIAATYIMNYYHEHGIRPHTIDIPTARDTVHLKHDALYCHIAQWTGMDVEEIRTLNPQYRTDMVPVSAGRRALTVPTNKVTLLLSVEDSIYNSTRDSLHKAPQTVEPQPATPAPAPKHVTHKVRKGDTLSKISKKYGVPVSTIKKRNKLKGDKISVGQTLIIK
ncbi:MAG: transglycosylase SLT domain-containing protein [Bacteroidales bacterium]|nr:transglycosylase SLT domain-containing protein [Bacteroidales bacterium]